MKSFLRSVLGALALGLALLPVVTVAQDGPPPEGGGQGGGARPTVEQMVERLDKAVTLTAEQKTKVTAIYKEQQTAMQAIPQEERREKGREAMAATQAKVRALLTPEQAKKFDEMPAPGRGGQGGDKKKKKN